MLPLPIWRTPLQADVFAQAAALGFVLPFAAVAWPVWRALRVQPVRRSGWVTSPPAAAAWPRSCAGSRCPAAATGRSRCATCCAPRAAACSPRWASPPRSPPWSPRSASSTPSAPPSTAPQHELLHAAPDRVTVTLDGFQPADGDVVRGRAALPQVGRRDPGLLLPGTARAGGHTVDLVIEVLPAGAGWTPT